MSNNKEKISALYDGEITDSEMEEILSQVSNDEIDKQLKEYTLLSAAILADSDLSKNQTKVTYIKFPDFLQYRPWLSNGMSAAAAIMLTVFLINPSENNRLGFNSEAQSQIQAAINSDEAKNNIIRIEEGLLEHMLNVLNQSNASNNNQFNPNLTNVGFKSSSKRPGHYTNGSENFYMHIAKKDLGLKKVRYWRSGKNMVYLYPLPGGKVITLYGNLSLDEANRIISSINIK